MIQTSFAKVTILLMCAVNDIHAMTSLSTRRRLPFWPQHGMHLKAGPEGGLELQGGTKDCKGLFGTDTDERQVEKITITMKKYIHGNEKCSAPKIQRCPSCHKCKKCGKVYGRQVRCCRGTTFCKLRMTNDIKKNVNQ